MNSPAPIKPASALFEGVVTHHRLRPKEHKLRYRVFSFLLDLDEIDGLAAKLKLFSRNRFNLFSFHDRDHADGGSADLRTRLEAILSDHGLADCGHKILLLCYPRLLGFVFNPLSVYFCHRADGSVGAVLYEVSNTFGDRHSYLIPVADGSLDDKNVLRQNAAFVGDRTELSDRKLIGAFIRYPLMTLKVVAGIHWEALHLWRKGMTFHKRPAPPKQAVTYVLETGTAAAQAGKR